MLIKEYINIKDTSIIKAKITAGTLIYTLGVSDIYFIYLLLYLEEIF